MLSCEGFLAMSEKRDSSMWLFCNCYWILLTFSYFMLLSALNFLILAAVNVSMSCMPFLTLLPVTLFWLCCFLFLGSFLSLIFSCVWFSSESSWFSLCSFKLLMFYIWWSMCKNSYMNGQVWVIHDTRCPTGVGFQLKSFCSDYLEKVKYDWCINIITVVLLEVLFVFFLVADCEVLLQAWGVEVLLITSILSMILT